MSTNSENLVTIGLIVYQISLLQAIVKKKKKKKMMMMMMKKKDNNNSRT